LQSSSLSSLPRGRSGRCSVVTVYFVSHDTIPLKQTSKSPSETQTNLHQQQVSQLTYFITLNTLSPSTLLSIFKTYLFCFIIITIITYLSFSKVHRTIYLFIYFLSKFFLTRLCGYLLSFAIKNLCLSPAARCFLCSGPLPPPPGADPVTSPANFNYLFCATRPRLKTAMASPGPVQITTISSLNISSHPISSPYLPYTTFTT